MKTHLKNKLRIGNWLKFKNNQQGGWNYTIITASSFEGGYIGSTFIPIEIDKNWLQGFNLKVCNKSAFQECYESENGQFIVQLCQNGFMIFIEVEDNAIYQLVKGGRYVHEFQNLWYYLTDVEPIFNPKQK